jgi:ABC-type multidrug transport system ATPase subunit
MGPSGAGKTTFLSILAGKVAKTEGSIKVNGKEQTLSLWKKLIGFVPQEDVMLSDLSVREILMVCVHMWKYMFEHKAGIARTLLADAFNFIS